MLIGNFVLSIIILFCFLCVLIFKPNKEDFISLIIERAIFISWLLFVCIIPIVVSAIMKTQKPYREMIHSAEFVQNEKKMQNTWGKKSFFLRLLLYFFLLMSPYLLGLLLIAFHAYFVN